MQRLLYISQSCINESVAEAVVMQIVAHAVHNNKQIGVTGALIFTGRHFAQILEGASDTIEVLMANIMADPRHKNVVGFDTSSITNRLFAEWQMAYHGPSQFVSRGVDRLLLTTTPSGRQNAAAWITNLAREFSTTRKQ